MVIYFPSNEINKAKACHNSEGVSLSYYTTDVKFCMRVGPKQKNISAFYDIFINKKLLHFYNVFFFCIS